MAMSSDAFDPGAVVAGKYRITRLVGSGGVGHVYRATHIELDTDVALKVLKPEMATRPDIVARFQREARASVRLQSEHIARVHDVGTHQNQPFFVMEYLVGADLAKHARDSEMTLTTLAELVIQACEGLAVAHARNVVHRDVKPENLFVVRDDSGWQTLKILDFGISKIALTGKVSEVDVASMRTEVMMGTPHYISPEQIRSTRDVDHRTDLWSMGVVLFEIASGGTMPFREERDVAALIAEILERPHRSLLEVAPHVPPELVAIVDKCLEKDPKRRFQTAAELAAALMPLAPKRARASVERASAAIRAAGLGDTHLRSSFPPPGESQPALRLPGAPRHPTPHTDPSIDVNAATLVGPHASAASMPAAPGSIPTSSGSIPSGSGNILTASGSHPVYASVPAATSSSNLLPGPPGMPSSMAPPPSRVPILVVGAVAITAIIGVVILLRDRARTPEVAAAPSASIALVSSAAPTPSASPTPPAAEAASSVASPAPAASSSPPTPSALAVPTHRNPFPVRPPGPITAPPSAKPATPSSGSNPLEIRHER